MTTHQRRNAIQLNNVERLLIDMYARQYNQTISQIEYLQGTLDEIRSSINNIIQGTMQNNEGTPTTPTTPSTPTPTPTTHTPRGPLRTSYTSPFRNYMNIYDYFNRDSQIYYDYDNPINPMIYTTNVNGTRRPLSNIISQLLNNSSVPTSRQIENATRLVRYSEIQNPITDVCPISLERFQPNDNVRQMRHCSHIFSTQSFNQWFTHSSLCPVCRHDIRTYRDTNGATNTHTNTHTNANTHTNTHTNANTHTNTTTNEHDQSDADTDTDTDTDIGSEEENENADINNLNVSRDANNNISQMTFDMDISNNPVATDMLTALTSELMQSILYGQRSRTGNMYNYRLGEQEFTYDASNNMLLYETILRI